MPTILLCHDGSDGAEQAAARAVTLFPDGAFTVLTVWEPFVEVLTHGGFGLAFGAPMQDVEEIDAGIERAARGVAEAQASELTARGLAAEALVRARGVSVAGTILDVAGEVGADVVVAGSRGRGGLRSILLGSVAHALLQHADRPVLVIPAEAVVAARREHR